MAKVNNKAILFTSYDRIPYLQEVLYSWDQVRGLEDWFFLAMIEPSSVQNQVLEEFQLFVQRAGISNYEIHINPERYGVLHHPWVGFNRLFKLRNFDFVVRAEDDLVVSDDILEMFEYTSEHYRDDAQIASIQGYNGGGVGADPSDLERSKRFSPWVWGTWADRWADYISPTWDHDYSTHNGEPGIQSGWDWNLDTRIFPSRNLRAIRPVISRVNNIGIHGTHSTPEIAVTSDSYRPNIEPQMFHEVDGIEYGDE